MSSAVPLLRAEFGEEVHLERFREPRGCAEGEVDVLVQHFRNIRTRHLHALGKLGLRHAQLLHAAEYAAEERGANMVNCVQVNLTM